MPLDELTPAWRLLADAGWQSTLLMAAGLLVAAILQRRHPGRAHDVLVAAALAAVLAPALAATVRELGFGLLPGSPLDSGPATAGPGAWADPGQTHDRHPVAWIDPAISLRGVAIAWLTVSAILLVRLRVSVLRARRLVATGRPPRAGEARRVHAAANAALLGPLPAVRVHPSLDSPATWRTRLAGEPRRRDVLLLPEHVLDLPSPELGAILAHECAHVQRRDPRHALGLALVTVILPWQPLAWAVRRRAASAREAACDAAAARVLDSPARYAELLYRLVASRDRAGAVRARRSPPAGLVVAMAAGTVQARIERLLACPPSPGSPASPASAWASASASGDMPLPPAADRAARPAAIVAAGLALSVAALQSPGTPPPPLAPTPPALTTTPADAADAEFAGDAFPARWTPASRTGDDQEAAGLPFLLVAADPLDLGTVDAGAVAAGALSIRNPGTEPLLIEAIRPNCGCIRVDDAALPLRLLPGADARFDFTMEAADEPEQLKTRTLLIRVRGHDTLGVSVFVRTAPPS